MAKVWVKGFTKSDGTKVKGHYRTSGINDTSASQRVKNIRGQNAGFMDLYARGTFSTKNILGRRYKELTPRQRKTLR